MTRDVHPGSGSQIQHKYKNPCGSGYDKLFWGFTSMYSMVIYEDLPLRDLLAPRYSGRILCKFDDIRTARIQIQICIPIEARLCTK
jgi:hypothetical protein